MKTIKGRGHGPMDFSVYRRLIDSRWPTLTIRSGSSGFIKKASRF